MAEIGFRMRRSSIIDSPSHSLPHGARAVETLVRSSEREAGPPDLEGGKLGRKKRTGETVPLSANRPNHVWCVDFIFDTCLNGTKLKILAVKDEFTNECLALEVQTRFRSSDVQRVLGCCLEAMAYPNG